MRVLKFGGTSVANAENINKVIEIVKHALSNEKLVVVVSALGGSTDALIHAGKTAANGEEQYKEFLQNIEQRHLQLIKELIPVAEQSSILSKIKSLCNELESICEGVFLLRELSDRTLDRIMSFGELMSSMIISFKLESLGLSQQWTDARSLIVTNSNYGSATVNYQKTNKQIHDFITPSSKQLFLVPGFIANDENQTVTTLGRGGSDYTAAIFAAALHASALEIWTDVSGMMTADPRLVQNVKAIPHISYHEAMELSHFGAKVIYPPTIQPVMSLKIPVWIKNTFAPNDYGTLIESEVGENENVVQGLSSIGKISLLRLEGSGMIGIPGFSKRLFEALSNEKINVILITQSSSEHSICVAIDAANTNRAKFAVDEAFSLEIAQQRVEPLKLETELSIVALVGDNMKSHPGISGRMFSALGRNGINIRAIAQGSSEKNISAVILSKDVKKAINVLHEEFFETVLKQVNLFVAGAGNVGGKLFSQLLQQQDYLQKHLQLNINVVAIANSKKVLLKEDGLDLKSWDTELANAPLMTLEEFKALIIEKNLRNSIFIDITADAAVAALYESLLQKSIAVVACNKIAASSNFKRYEKLKDLAREFNTSFLFETNVGAGLPVIGSLNDLIRSGDTIQKMEAVLSGTLNFVFNNYNGTVSFAEVVREAQNQGFTEPDPRLDLSGIDVMRKILILSREAGLKMELEDIACNSFMPEVCMQGDVANFYKVMESEEAYFKALYEAATQKDCKLKFVATLENGKASVGLQHIPKEHDLFHLYGKDNVVLFYTNRYPLQPLVIKGAGAGGDVTASGVFADIIRAARV